jgi:hypothetical protein
MDLFTAAIVLFVLLCLISLLLPSGRRRRESPSYGSEAGRGDDGRDQSWDDRGAVMGLAAAMGAAAAAATAAGQRLTTWCVIGSGARWADRPGCCPISVGGR